MKKAIEEEALSGSPVSKTTLRSSSRFPRRILLNLLALLFAAAAVTYSVAWMYYVRLEAIVELGIDTRDIRNGNAAEITSVWPDSPAKAAGLRPKDRIVAVNGQPLTGQGRNVANATWVRGRPGDKLILTVERPGQSQAFDVEATLRRFQDIASRARAIAGQIVVSYPVLFLVVGLGVLFLRVDDANAWRLAVLFVCFVGASNIPYSYASAPPGLRTFLLAYRSISLGLLGPSFLFLFSLFPEPSPSERRAPWLKWIAVAVGLIIGSFGIPAGVPGWPPPLAHALGEQVSRNAILAFIYGPLLLGFASLGWNAAAAESTQAKRKIRVITWGAFVGLTPAIVAGAVSNVFHYRVPFWEDVADIILLSVFPLSFAYAVVKHQVLEIPALLRRSARYVLVRRGFAFLLVLLAITVNVLLAISLSRLFRMQPALAMSIGGGLGVALAWMSAPGVRQTTQRIDRAFFREAYDARIVLQDLAQKVRSIVSRQELAELIKKQLQLALHPASLAVYLRTSKGQLEVQTDTPALPGIPAQGVGLARLAEIGGPVDTSTYDDLSSFIPELALQRPECLVPALGRSNDLLALIVLGAKLSEEPYSQEDRQLLGSVASQAGLALESISLAEKMAERMEADRRAEQEMQIARAVQSKLLPQQAPGLATLDYAGACIQARAVGGDYYDFLDLGSGRVGFVLADIAGKGISGALLMANLQASLRSLSAAAHRNLPEFLCSVNRLFFKNTETSHYATMFFGLYDDSARRLEYANCGHNPPLLLRDGGKVERLEATAMVLGLFEQWDCRVAEVSLNPGDTLAIYTDGITEAANGDQEEFGEERLISVLRMNEGLAASALLQKVLKSVQEFSPGEQGDDLTLIVAVTR